MRLAGVRHAWDLGFCPLAIPEPWPERLGAVLAGASLGLGKRRLVFRDARTDGRRTDGRTERLGTERLGTERLGTERLGTERLGTDGICYQLAACSPEGLLSIRDALAVLRACCPEGLLFWLGAVLLSRIQAWDLE